MAHDFGGARRRRKSIAVPVLVLGAVALVVAYLAGSWVWHRPREIRKAQAWAISGAACQQVSAQAFAAQPVQIHARFENNDITFGRGYGHVSCDDITNDGGRGYGTFTECQFNSPGALEVATKTVHAYFLTGGGPATVTVKKDAVSCVLAGKFKGEQSTPGE
ncbi:MAG TPA: hypothetical protein VIJ94_06865 [Caulobacteraceae bacterium]